MRPPPQRQFSTDSLQTVTPMPCGLCTDSACSSSGEWITASTFLWPISQLLWRWTPQRIHGASTNWQAKWQETCRGQRKKSKQTRERKVNSEDHEWRRGICELEEIIWWKQNFKKFIFRAGEKCWMGNIVILGQLPQKGRVWFVKQTACDVFSFSRRWMEIQKHLRKPKSKTHQECGVSRNRRKWIVDWLTVHARKHVHQVCYVVLVADFVRNLVWRTKQEWTVKCNLPWKFVFTCIQKYKKW